MELIRFFENISKNDAPIAGGKGASLGEMTQAGIPVPPGFVILSEAFESFLEATDLNVEIDTILHTVETDKMHTVEHASETIQKLILEAPMPETIGLNIEEAFTALDTPYVAVRSSATAEDSASAAWAGQLDSFLNTNEEKLLENVKRCWASLFTPRAIFYRFEKGLHNSKISVAVVIQQMVASEISGIAFSVHPVTEDRNQLIIEAGFGLGEAIVSGTITPDSYVVEKEPRRIIDTNISTQTKALYRKEAGGNVWRDIPEPKASSQVLTESQILELSDIILIIENHYGFPCDIEWAYEGGKFYVVQSRPITTLMHNDTSSSDTKINIPDFIHHVAFLASRPQSVQRDEAVYMFLKRWEHLGVGVVSIPLEGLNRALYVEKTSIDTIYKEVMASISTEQGLDGHLRTYEKLMVEYQEVIRVFRSVDSQKEYLKSALNLFIEACVKLTDYVWVPFTIDTDFGVLFREKLKKESGDRYESILGGVSSPTRFHEYQNMRLAMCEHVIDGDDMRQAAADLTEKYAWYGEYSYVEKLYDEEYFQTELAKLTSESAADEKKKLNDDLRENIRRFKGALSKIGDPTTALYARIINQYLFLRTDRVDSFKKLQTALRNVFEKIAENLGKETGERWSMEEVVSMTNEEILKYLDGVTIPDKAEMTRRTHRYVYFRNPQVTRVLTEESEMNGITDVVLSSVGQDEGVRGLVAYKGVVTGRVATVFGKDDLHKVTDGSVLVARTTMVDYISAMERAVAFVTEEGGVTSHAAIVARELKKPCIVGTGNCTRMLKDGDLVEVDADNGVVRIIQDGQDIVKNPEADLSYAGNTWFMTITRNMSFWHQYLSDEGHFRYTKDFEVDAELQVLHITKGGTETSVFMHNPNYNEYSEAVLEKVSTEDGIVDLKKKYHSYAQQLLSALDRIKSDLTVELLEDFFDAYRRFSAGLMITATLGRSGADKLTETLKVLGYTEEEIPQMNSLITYPQEHTPLFQSRLDLLKIGIAVQEKSLGGDALQKSLSRWLSEYGHIPVNFCESPWSLDDARKQLDNLLREDCTEEYTKAEKNHKELTEKGKRLLEKIGNEKVSILAHAVAEGTHLNEFRKNVFSRVSLEYRGIFEEIAKQAGSGNWRDCFYLTPIEMLDILSGANMDISSLVEEREIAGMYVDAEGMSHLLDKDAIDQFRSYILNIHGSSKENTHGDIIKGSSANRGKVTGTARLILSSKDFDKLSPGEILVTTMTSVDFVPVMGRAAAFVTNEGGITSHASIVAREMNKPCIIGTKIATQVLKDGMFVEVDANEGIVRILKT